MKAIAVVRSPVDPALCWFWCDACRQRHWFRGIGVHSAPCLSRRSPHYGQRLLLFAVTREAMQADRARIAEEVRERTRFGQRWSNAFFARGEA
jgi:hypothetical protein